MARILKGDTAELANGWKLARARVSDDLRIEVDAGYLTPAAVRELLSLGAMQEKIALERTLLHPHRRGGRAGADGAVQEQASGGSVRPERGSARRHCGHEPRPLSPPVLTHCPDPGNQGRRGHGQGACSEAMVNGPKVVVAFDMGDPVSPCGRAQGRRQAAQRRRQGRARGLLPPVGPST